MGAALLALGIAAALVALGRPGERAGRGAVLGACCAAASAQTALLLAVVTPGWALGAALACAVLLPTATAAAVRSEPADHARQVSG
jgi:MFS family permease